MVGLKHKAILQYVLDHNGCVELRALPVSLYKAITDIYALNGTASRNNIRRHQISTVLINNGYLDWDKSNDMIYLTEKGKKELSKGV